MKLVYRVKCFIPKNDTLRFHAGQPVDLYVRMENIMTDPTYIIDVKNLNKSFDGIRAVINAHLQVKKGEIFGFLGPNGSGKRLLFVCYAVLLVPDSGSRQFLGYDVIKELKDNRDT